MKKMSKIIVGGGVIIAIAAGIIILFKGGNGFLPEMEDVL